MSILDDLDLSSIADERIRQCLVFLVNLVEDQKREISELRAENQRLRDEINRLKGEQGKPTIKGNKPLPGKAAVQAELVEEEVEMIVGMADYGAGAPPSARIGGRGWMTFHGSLPRHRPSVVTCGRCRTSHTMIIAVMKRISNSMQH